MEYHLSNCMCANCLNPATGEIPVIGSKTPVKTTVKTTVKVETTKSLELSATELVEIIRSWAVQTHGFSKNCRVDIEEQDYEPATCSIVEVEIKESEE